MDQESKAAQLAAYIQALQRHDWAFEWSDNHGIWRAGRDSLEALRRDQKQVDPDFMVWNQFCPAEWRIRSLAVKVAA